MLPRKLEATQQNLVIVLSGLRYETIEPIPGAYFKSNVGRGLRRQAFSS